VVSRFVRSGMPVFHSLREAFTAKDRMSSSGRYNCRPYNIDTRQDSYRSLALPPLFQDLLAELLELAGWPQVNDEETEE
jgi:hypothetical protein